MVSTVNEKLEGKYPWYINNSVGYDGVGLFLTADGRYKKQHYSQADLMDAETAEHALDILNKRMPKKARMQYYLEGYISEGMKIQEGSMIIGITDKGQRVFWNDGDQEWFDDPEQGTQFSNDEARRVYFTIDKQYCKAQKLKLKRVFIGEYSPE